MPAPALNPSTSDLFCRSFVPMVHFLPFRNCCKLALLCSWFLASSGYADSMAATDSAAALHDRVVALEAQLAAMQASLRALSSRQDSDLRQRVSQTTSADLVRRGPFALSVSGFVQADATLYRQDSEDQLDGATGQPLNETRFVIRRARVRVTADSKYVGGLLELDGNTVQGSQVRLMSAELWAQWPASNGQTPQLRGSLGLMKIPFGREVLELDVDRLFLERSQIVRALFPGEYDLGVRLHGGFRFLRYSLAAMNGAPLGDAAFSARDPNQSKDLVGKLSIDADPAAWLTLRAGASFVYGTGFSPGSLASKDVLVFRDDNDDGQVQQSEIQVIRGRAAVPSQNFSRDALGIDGEVTARIPLLGKLVVSGELIWARNLDRSQYIADPVAAGRDLRELGYYVGVTQELSPYVRAGLRYDFYDPDADAEEQRGTERVPLSTSFSSLTVTLAGFYPGYGRLAFEYQHNRNALGRSSAGIPITLGRDVVLIRGQVSF
jgi:hypothetical protein